MFDASLFYSIYVMATDAMYGNGCHVLHCAGLKCSAGTLSAIFCTAMIVIAQAKAETKTPAREFRIRT